MKYNVNSISILRKPVPFMVTRCVVGEGFGCTVWCMGQKQVWYEASKGGCTRVLP